MYGVLLKSSIMNSTHKIVFRRIAYDLAVKGLCSTDQQYFDFKKGLRLLKPVWCERRLLYWCYIHIKRKAYVFKCLHLQSIVK